MHRVGTELLNRKKTEIAGVGEDPSQLLGRDILSALVKDNMQESEAQKLTDEEVLARELRFAVSRHHADRNVSRNLDIHRCWS